MEAEIYKTDYVKRIKGNFTALVDQIDAKELLDYLFQEGAINEDEMEAVDTRPPRAANRKLLSILSKKEFKAFGIFLNALRLAEANEHIVKHLLAYDASTCPPDSMEMEKEVDSDQKLEMLNEQLWKQTTLLMDIQNRLDSMKLESTTNTEGDTFDSAQVQELEDVTKDIKSHIKDYVDSQIAKTLESRGILEIPPDQLSTDKREGSDKDEGTNRPLYQRMQSYRKRETLDPNVERISIYLAKDIIQYLSMGSDYKETPDIYALTMRRLVDQLLESQSEFFEQVMINLPLDKMNGLDTICAVADEMLTGGYHWGKVVALFSYVGWIGKFFTRPGKVKETDEFLETLGNFLGHYVNNRLGKWIQQNDGWDGFLRRFEIKTGDKAETGEGRLVNSLIWTAVGLGAVTTLVLATK